MLEPSGCQPAPSLSPSGGQARGHDSKEARNEGYGNEGRLGKRFAIVIGLAGAGVMALGAQTAAAAPGVVKYDTKVTLSLQRPCHVFRRAATQRSGSASVGDGWSCSRCGPGRIASSALPEAQVQRPARRWRVSVLPRGLQGGDVVYAKVRREVHDEFVCRGDRSELDPLGCGGPGLQGPDGLSRSSGTFAPRSLGVR